MVEDYLDESNRHSAPLQLDQLLAVDLSINGPAANCAKLARILFHVKTSSLVYFIQTVLILFYFFVYIPVLLNSYFMRPLLYSFNLRPVVFLGGISHTHSLQKIKVMQ